MRNLPAIIAATCVLAWNAAMAQEPLRVGPPGGAIAAGPPPPAVPPPVRPAEVPGSGASLVPPSGSPIVLEAGKGTLIRLSRAAGTVFIANPDVADVQVKSPSLIYLTAKAPGQTAIYAVDAEDRVLLNRPVRVEHDLLRLRQSIHAMAPGQNVTVGSVDNALVLGGTVASAGQAATVSRLATAIAKETKGEVSNRMAVATPNQVNIRVKVAEINREVLKSLGVNWRKANGSFRIATENPVTDNLITDRNVIGVLVGGYNAATLVTLDALAQENLLTTLAEPNLTATNGQTASFLAGGEFPVPVASNTVNGFPTTTIEFKSFGVTLDIVPTIIDPAHLVLKIRSGVSELSTAGAITVNDTQIPALTVRRAETTVELGSGQSFVLGGLLQDNVIQDISKIPWLGDIPILGQLFRSERFKRRETELVIIVTPYLVKPSNRMPATPLDGFRAPSDAQRIIDASTYRQGLPAPPAAMPCPVRRLSPRSGSGWIDGDQPMKPSSFWLVCATLMGLAACSPATEYTESEWPKNLRLDPAPAQLAVGFAPGSSRIPPGDLARLRAAAASGGIVPSDRVVVAVAGPPLLAAARFEAVAAALLPYGIVPIPEPGLSAPGTAVIRRERYLVTLPACPDWSKPAAGAGDFTNTHSSNFGCAAAVNLGLMIAQPADLVEPRQAGLTDARPAADAVNTYRLGRIRLPAAANVGPIAAPANQPAPPPAAGEGEAGTGPSGAQR